MKKNKSTVLENEEDIDEVLPQPMNVSIKDLQDVPFVPEIPEPPRTPVDAYQGAPVDYQVYAISAPIRLPSVPKEPHHAVKTTSNLRILRGIRKFVRTHGNN